MRLIDVSGKNEFGFKDLFHQTHVNNVVHLNRSKSFFKMLFKCCSEDMGAVCRAPTPCAPPIGLQVKIANDKKLVNAANQNKVAKSFDVTADDFDSFWPGA